MDIESQILQIKKDMNKALDFLEEQFSWLQMWKASPKLLENMDIYIPARWSETKISNIANVTNMDSQTLRIEPREKSHVSSINKWINDANIWLNPQDMGEYVIIKIPALTTERRKDLTKIVAKYAEEAKVSIRNIRHDYLNKCKKQFEAKEISETDKTTFEKKLDEVVKDFNFKIDKETSNKSDDVMKV